MMDRSQKLAILSAMDDEHLSLALEGVGIDCCGMDEDPLGEDASNALDKWNEIEVSVPDAGRGPIVDKSALFMPKQEVMTNTYGLPEPGEDEDLMMATGMV